MDAKYCASRPGRQILEFEVAGHGKKARGHLETNKRWVQDLPVCCTADVACFCNLY